MLRIKIFLRLKKNTAYLINSVDRNTFEKWFVIEIER